VKNSTTTQAQEATSSAQLDAQRHGLRCARSLTANGCDGDEQQQLLSELPDAPSLAAPRGLVEGHGEGRDAPTILARTAQWPRHAPREEDRRSSCLYRPFEAVTDFFRRPSAGVFWRDITGSTRPGPAADARPRGRLLWGATRGKIRGDTRSRWPCCRAFDPLACLAIFFQ
jgi:hypothetical protein